jgi:hypothetical protein
LLIEDGNALVENIFISDKLSISTDDIGKWPGYKSNDDPGDEYFKKLIRMSSTLPNSFRTNMDDYGICLGQDTVMTYPGLNAELIQMAFCMSTLSGTGNLESNNNYESQA